jgi:hypothetical protein
MEFCKNFFYTPHFEKDEDEGWRMADGKGWHEFP